MSPETRLGQADSLPLVLASQSGSRKAMLAAAGVAFEARPAHLDERQLEDELGNAPAPDIARTLAVAKAQAVSSEMPGRIVLGSDSLVVAGDRRFDKPADRVQAAEHLRSFSGQPMELHSAAALVRDGAVLWAGTDRAILHVRQLSDAFIERYLDAEWPEVGYCVGVFRIEAMGVQLFEAIEGDQFTVLGMPLLQVLGALRDAGELQS